jgi:hypothetical protein
MNVDDDMLSMLGVTRQNILNDMLQKKLILAEVDSLGLTVSDDLLRKEITASSDFQEGGKFNLDSFKRFLYVRGLREHKYLDQLRKEISGNVLLGTLFGNIELPEKISQMQLDSAGTKYDIELTKIPANFAELKVIADDETLQTYLNSNTNIFEREETRKVSFFELDKLDDARESLEMATAIEDEVAGGATLQEIAKKHSATVMQKDVTANDSSDIAKKAVELSVGDIEVIEKDDAYSIVQLDDVKESYVPELAEIRTDVEREWKEAEKQRLSREYAIELFESKAENNSNLQTENLNKISAQELAQKGYTSLRGLNIVEAKAGESFALLETLDGNYAIAKLKGKKIEKLAQKDMEAYQDSLQQAYASELQQDYMKYLAEKHGVEFNPEANPTQQQ